MSDAIGCYDVQRELGRGGMGVVYLARDNKLDRDVAIKILPEAMACDTERVLRFEREAKLLASLNHTNIAQIYGFEEHRLETNTVRPENCWGADSSVRSCLCCWLGGNRRWRDRTAGCAGRIPPAARVSARRTVDG